MSDALSNKFSDALNRVLSYLILSDLKNSDISINVMDFLNVLIPIVTNSTIWNGVTLSFGKPGNSSQMLRCVERNVFELHFYLAFPFQLTPIRDEMRTGCVMLQTSADVKHPTVANGFLDRKAVAEWLYEILLKSSGRWVLSEFRRDFSVIYGDTRVICLPVLEFMHSQWPADDRSLQKHPWYAVPKAARPLDSRSFVVWAPDWELCILNTHKYSQHLLSLVGCLARANYAEFKNFDLVIRTIMLQEVHNLPRDLGDSMITFLEAVVARLQEGTLNRFMVESINVLQSVEDSLLEQSHRNLNKALMDLKEHAIKAQIDNGSDNVYDYHGLYRIFKLK